MAVARKTRLDAGQDADLVPHKGKALRDRQEGADVITDFDGADDTIALHGFVTADVKIWAEGSDTVIDLPGPDQITLRGVSQFDPEGLLCDMKHIVR
jgi:hypothetical protein